MTYFGKEFSFEKEENFEGFVKALGLPEEATEGYLKYKPKTKIEKDGDTYKFTNISPEGTRVVEFKSGVEFDEQVRPDTVLRSKYTVDGDTITQVSEKDGKVITFKREFTADTLKVNITTSFWDGVAVRYYKA